MPGARLQLFFQKTNTFSFCFYSIEKPSKRVKTQESFNQGILEKNKNKQINSPDKKVVFVRREEELLTL